MQMTRIFSTLLIVMFFGVLFAGGVINSPAGAEYPAVLEKIEHTRLELLRQYQQADEKGRKEILIRAQAYLERVFVEELLPMWVGTPWSFYGDSKKPLRGKIACGAFVENTLRDAGFIVSERLSQQPAELIIRNMVSPDQIRRFRNKELDDFLGAMRLGGDGLFIVGLDNHVGFLLVKSGKCYFIHSMPYSYVKRMNPRHSPFMKSSAYRVTGKLFQGPMVKKWLLGKRFVLLYDYFSSRGRKAK